MADNNQIQLGFALNNSNTDADDASDYNPELGHRSAYWSDWDGGKIGGQPSWLNPRDLPDAPLRCRACSKDGKDGAALRFVAQLYCPADDATENDAAFHRSVYVFACPTCCSEQKITENKTGEDDASSTNNLTDCIRVLRCQLPKQNDFYPTKGDGDDNDDWEKHTSQYWAKSTNNDKLNICAVCGQKSKGKCPKQQLWFCGPDHQKECLRASKQIQEQASSTDNDDDDADIPLKYLQSVCYESELVVEEEPASAAASDEKNFTEESKSTLFDSKGFTDDDADLEQSDLNAITGNESLAQAATGVTDPTTLAFYARMGIGGKENDVRDQCLRYCLWPTNEKTVNDGDEEEEGGTGPLWISSNNRPDSNEQTNFPPPCQYCGAPRAFEFQILPQMLHYLLQNPDSSTKANDNNDEKGRQVLTEAERAVLLEAKSKIESGMELPEGFKEQHDAAVARARDALLGIKDSSKAGESDGTKTGLDWGTIAVYTCTASCGDGKVGSAGENGAYLEEAAWVQPPLD